MFSLLKPKHKPKKNPKTPASELSVLLYRLSNDAIQVRKLISVKEQLVCVSGLFISVENTAIGSSIIFVISQLVT